MFAKCQVILCIFSGFFALVSAKNCTLAPKCPDLVTWKPGFICNDNFTVSIHTRLIDGIKIKTICCRAINSCVDQSQFNGNPESTSNTSLIADTLPFNESISVTLSSNDFESINLSTNNDSNYDSTTFPSFANFISDQLNNSPNVSQIKPESNENSSIKPQNNNNLSERPMIQMTTSKFTTFNDNLLTNSGELITTESSVMNKSTAGWMNVESTVNNKPNQVIGMDTTANNIIGESLLSSSTLSDSESNQTASTTVKFTVKPTRFTRSTTKSTAINSEPTVSSSASLPSMSTTKNPSISTSTINSITFSSFKPTKTKKTRRTTTTVIKSTTNNDEIDKNTSNASWLFTTEPISTEKDENISNESNLTIFDNKVEGFLCAPKWKSLSPKSSFLFDGIDTGSLKSDFLSYIGRMRVNGIFMPGEIDLEISSSSVYFNSIKDITNESLNYLSKSPSQTYSWLKSSSGVAERNAIAINEIYHWPFYIGRISINRNIFIGKVLPSIGLRYIDKYRNEKIAKYYEVLICESVIDENVNECAKK